MVGSVTPKPRREGRSRTNQDRLHWLWEQDEASVEWGGHWKALSLGSGRVQAQAARGGGARKKSENPGIKDRGELPFVLSCCR